MDCLLESGQRTLALAEELVVGRKRDHGGHGRWASVSALFQLSRCNNVYVGAGWLTDDMKSWTKLAVVVARESGAHGSLPSFQGCPLLPRALIGLGWAI